MNQRQTIDPLARAQEFWQRVYMHKWLVLLGIVGLSAVAIVVISLLPDYYQASTAVLFNPQMLPDRYIAPTVTSDPAQRITTLTEELLSSSRLVQVAQEVFVYNDPGKMPADIAEQMRKSIRVDMKPSTDRDMSAFVITYTGKNPQIAAQVTNRLADSFIGWDLQAREQQAQTTTEFLSSQVGEARQALSQAEAKLTSFKRTHPGELPDDLQTTAQSMYRLQAAMQENRERVEHLQQQRALLMDPESTQASNGKLSERARLTLEQENLQSQLNNLRAEYTDSYPDVVAANQRLRAVTQQLKELPPASIDANSPATRLNLIEQQLQQLNTEQETLSARIDMNQSKIASAPALGQEAEGLTRDYEIAKQQYDSLLDKRFQAGMAADLQREQRANRFVVEPALVPKSPIKPNRLLFFAAGLLLSFAIPPVCAIAWPEVRGTVESRQSLRQLVPTFATLVSEIPHIPSSSEFKRQRRLATFSLAGSCITIVGIIAFLWIVHPHV